MMIVNILPVYRFDSICFSHVELLFEDESCTLLFTTCNVDVHFRIRRFSITRYSM